MKLRLIRFVYSLLSRSTRYHTIAGFVQLSLHETGTNYLTMEWNDETGLLYRLSAGYVPPGTNLLTAAPVQAVCNICTYVFDPAESPQCPSCGSTDIRRVADEIEND